MDSQTFTGIDSAKWHRIQDAVKDKTSISITTDTGVLQGANIGDPMQIDTSKLTDNWKSSIMGTLVLVIAASSSVHFDVAGHLTMTAKDWFTCGIGVLGQIVGLLQKDVPQ